ncbi:hypothetical protein [Acutalibacter muris]|nr:hypothetical protein [Acutalibacter muris]
MNQQNNARFYFMQKALEYLLEKGAIIQEEADRTSRNNAEILRPDPEYIR